MKRSHKTFSNLLAVTSLDSELQPRIPLLELAGDGRVLIENHQSVVHYSLEKVVIGVDFGQFCIHGQSLRLMKLAKEQLVVTGRIDSIFIHREGSL